MQGVFDPPSPRPSGPDELGETRFQARESGGAAEYVLPTEVEYFARFRQRTREAPDGKSFCRCLYTRGRPGEIAEWIGSRPGERPQRSC